MLDYAKHMVRFATVNEHGPFLELFSGKGSRRSEMLFIEFVLRDAERFAIECSEIDAEKILMECRRLSGVTYGEPRKTAAD